MRMLTLLLLAAALVTAACTGGPAELVLTAADAGKTVSAAPGQVVEIRLDSNQTTGFRWNMAAAPDEKVIKLLSTDYRGGGMPGAGGRETWKFQAVGAGKATIKLAYHRPHEPGLVSREFTVTVEVK